MQSDPSCHSLKPTELSRWLPVFPLPNVVLLPKVVLPLHVFEQRYREMTIDALSGPRLIAMALLKPGYEPHYHTLRAPVHEVVGVGRILREERLPDGRYNFLLQGLARARIVEENRELPYRRAMIEVLASEATNHEYVYRHELLHMISRDPLAPWAERAGWPELFNCTHLQFSELVDVIASSILSTVEEKQAFLEEPDVSRRAKRLCAALSVLAGNLAEQPTMTRPLRVWPPAGIPN